MTTPFHYDEAFSRNIGWITETEQQLLRTRRVAIAGLGGVGGSHLLTLTRLGIGRFHIADLDAFELANFNRQAGAFLSHLGRPKVEALEQLAREINPELEIRTFPQGVTRENLGHFLDGVDLYVDGLDFFALDIRRAVFAACAEKGIPAVTAAPLGMGVALLNFLPSGMTFEEYFRLEGQPEDEQLLRFLLGLSPAMLQMPYLVDDSRVDLEAHKGPSTPMACELCAGVAATQALKILLRRGKVIAAPRGLHFDAYRNRLKITWRPGGNRNPLQRLGLKIARGRLSEKKGKKPVPERPAPDTPIERILDLARWAPSGDNTQPWKFEVLDERRFLVHAHDTRDWCVYDLDGHASQIAVGALLETIAIAATGEGMEADFRLLPDCPETAPVIEVSLKEKAGVVESPLLPYIRVRTTQRRPFETTPLSPAQKQALEAAVGEGFGVRWIESPRARWQMAKLLFRSAKIRLTIPEAYEVHKRIIEWDAQFSTDRIPDQAVGLDPATLKLMKWVMQSWKRVRFMNRWLAGTLAPRLQLDLVPGYRCAAHFLILAHRPPETLEEWFAAGRALQRFWLTATRLGLQLQPEMTPLIFSRYTKESVNFTSESKALGLARAVTNALEGMVGREGVHQGVFLGRVGVGRLPAARSLRRAVRRLQVS